VTQDAVRLHVFQFSLLGKVKQWFYSNKEAMSTWEKFSNPFLTKFFPWAKEMPSKTRSLCFSNSRMRPSLRHGNIYRIISLHALINGIKEWFINQSFYHGVIHSAQEHIDVAARGCFFALSIEEAHKLVEKMASNQS
jgi:hypothetical protein